jgi:hypothetical protein
VRFFAAAVGTAALALWIPAASGASLYCVGTSAPDCAFGYAGTGDGLQQALTAADTNVDISGTPDTVRIGPGTYEQTNGTDFQTGGGDITVLGAGQATILTTDSGGGRTVLHNTGGSGGAVRNLRVDVAGDASGIVGFHTVSDVRVTGPGRARVAVSATSGSRITRVLIDPATIGAAGVMAYGNVTVEDVAVRLRAATTTGQGVGLATDIPPGSYSATVRHLTVLGNGRQFTNGVEVTGVGDAAGARTLNANIRDSVLRNVAHPIDRIAGTNTPGKPGTANVTYRYSSLNATKNTAAGPGSTTSGPGNLPDPDPLFAPNLTLSAGSPLIDAGDPGGAQAGDSPTDLAGTARIIGARRDIGAFEAGPATGPGQGLPGGATAASLRTLGISPRTFRAARRGPSVSAARRRAKVGTTVRYALNVDASVRFSVRQSLRGRRVRRGKKARCVKPTHRNRTARRCRRSKTRGRFTQPGHVGGNSFRFRGRLRGRKLKPGRYTLVARPTANGVRGRAIRTRFRIVK